MVPPKDIFTMITNGEGECDQNILAFANNFIIDYEQLLEAYNGSQCVTILIKNVTVTSKGD
jgi:hypothetical protein